MFQTEVIEKIKTHIIRSVTFSPEIRVVYEITRKNMVVPDRPQRIIWRMRFACLITKATDTHSEYVLLNVFARQQWLRCINGRKWISSPIFRIS
jgi:hypothetical protein